MTKLSTKFKNAQDWPIECLRYIMYYQVMLCRQYPSSNIALQFLVLKQESPFICNDILTDRHESSFKTQREL